jgi:hypothetical protein
MMVGIAVLTTVASSAPSDMPRRSPAVIALRRGRLMGGCAEDDDIPSSVHDGNFRVQKRLRFAAWD